MKLEVTQKGVRALGNEVAVGTIIDVKGDKVPDSLVNKVVEVGKRTAIINPENGGEPKTYDEMTRAELDKLAEDRKVDVKEAKNKGDVIAALQLADEAAKTA